MPRRRDRVRARRGGPGGAGETSVFLTGNDFAIIRKREPMPLLSPFLPPLSDESQLWSVGGSPTQA